MPLHHFKGPVTNDKTAVFIKKDGITRSSNLVKSIRDAATDDAKWSAVKTWAGADDADVIRLPASITEMPDFVATPNRLNVEVYDGTNQSRQVLGIGQTPDLDITITLFDPGNDDDHATLYALPDGTMMDIVVLTATTWKAANTEHIDGTALEATGFAALVVGGKPFMPGGAAGDYSRLTVPMAYQSHVDVVASY